jgi:hypothetical protein
MSTDTVTFSREATRELIKALKKARADVMARAAEHDPERPRWMAEIGSFDGLEIHPVREVREAEGSAGYCEQCEPHEAQFWSVYGHFRSGGVLCLEDFPGEAEASQFAHRLLDEWPHLRTFGLLR